ncbi:MAG: hypothetical protein ABIE94_02100 [archaeon]
MSDAVQSEVGKDVTWGLDLISESVLDREMPPVEQMGIDDVRSWLELYDRELSAAEEEADLDTFYKTGGRDPVRPDLADEARRRKTEIGKPGSHYARLIDRFSELASSPIDLRAADLRSRRSLYDAVSSNAEFERLKDEALTALRTKKIDGGPHGDIELGEAVKLLQTEQDADVRRKIYMGKRNLEGIEEMLHTEITHLTEVARNVTAGTDTPFQNFFELNAHVAEVGTAEHISTVMRTFIEGTRGVYNQLVRELVTDETINPWDYAFLYTQQDPFTKLPVPQDPWELFDLGLQILEDLGYERAFLRDFYNPKKAGVYFDIEDRKGKTPGAGTFSLGPFSTGKNMMYYAPVIFEGNPRRRYIVFPHELGHGIDHEFAREAVENHGQGIFFTDAVPGRETISTFHEHATLDKSALHKYLGLSEDDARHFAKWQLLHVISQLYSIAGVTLGELGMHTKGVEYARESAFEAESLIRPDIIATDLGPSSDYVSVHHLIEIPAYYFGYYFAHENQMALTGAWESQVGSVFNQRTAPWLIDNIMIGNVKPMRERVADATGITDPAQYVAEYVQREHARLQEQ